MDRATWKEGKVLDALHAASTDRKKDRIESCHCGTLALRQFTENEKWCESLRTWVQLRSMVRDGVEKVRYRERTRQRACVRRAKSKEGAKDGRSLNR